MWWYSPKQLSLWKRHGTQIYKSFNYETKSSQTYFSRLFSVGKPSSVDVPTQTLQDLMDQYEAWKERSSTVSDGVCLCAVGM